MKKNTISLALLLSVTSLSAMDKETIVPAAGSLAKEQVQAQDDKWLNLFGGNFAPMDMTRLASAKKGQDALNKKDYAEALSYFTVLAEAGHLDSMLRCSELSLELAFSLLNVDKPKNKNQLRKLDTEIAKQLKIRLEESRNWAWLGLLKEIDEKPKEKPLKALKNLGGLQGKITKSKTSQGFIQCKSDLKDFSAIINRMNCYGGEDDPLNVMHAILDKSFGLNHYFTEEMLLVQFKWLVKYMKDSVKEEVFSVMAGDFAENPSCVKFFPIFTKNFEAIGLNYMTNTMVLHKLSCMYFNGSAGKDLTNEQRDAKAEDLYLQCQDLPDAKRNLAIMYEQGRAGKDLTQEERDEKAVTLLLQCQELPASRHNLAIMYEQGRAGKDLTPEKRYAKAEALFLQCQELPEAKNKLAIMYLKGTAGKDLTPEKRYAKAEALFLQCQDFPEAKSNLALMYCEGRAGKELTQEQCYAKAEALFLQCQELPEARHNLAHMYILEIASKSLNKAEKEAFIKDCIPTLPDCMKVSLQEAIEMKKLKDMVSPNQGVYQEVLHNLHSDELLYGDNMNFSEKLAQAIEEQEDEHRDNQEENQNDSDPTSTKKEEGKEVIIETSAPEENIEAKEKAPKLSAKEKKHAKQQMRTLREIQKIARDRRNKFMLTTTDTPQKSEKKARTIVFACPAVEQEYKDMLSNKTQGKKLDDIVKDILFYGHRTAGVGKPEILKSGNYVGCWSRRINGADRIVYKVEGDKIVIFESSGHYQLSK